MDIRPLGFGFLHRDATLKKKPIVTVNIEEQVRHGLLLALITEEGERPLAKHYGSRLKKMAFKIKTPDFLLEIESEIRRCLQVSEPRVEVKDVKITHDEHELNTVRAEISYKILSSGMTQSLIFPLDVME